MPELPEVEVVRQGLLRLLPGKKIETAQVLRTESIAFPKPRIFAKAMIGKIFTNIERRGKYLLCHFDDGSGLGIHLRMSGRLIVWDERSVPRSERFLRVRLYLDNGTQLLFEDMRVFGRLWYVPVDRSFGEIIPALNTLGDEPLPNLAGAKLLSLLAGRSQTIKSALLDQHLLAGIGNIYADESLFQAKISPLTPAGAITATQAKRLARAVCEVLDKAIELGGSSLRDYTDSLGVNGKYQQQSQVYGRVGQSCYVCGSTIQKIKIAGRSSYYCLACQRLPTLR